MLTAHRTLGNIPGTYGRGWEIIDDDGQVVARVATRAAALRAIAGQRRWRCLRCGHAWLTSALAQRRCASCRSVRISPVSGS